MKLAAEKARLTGTAQRDLAGPGTALHPRLSPRVSETPVRVATPPRALVFLVTILALASTAPTTQAQVPAEQPASNLAPTKAALPGTVITGRVLHGSSGRPVPTAVVGIADLDIEVLCDTDGRFVIENLPDGPLELVVAAPGYRKRQLSVRARPNARGELAIRLRAQPGDPSETVVRSDPPWRVAQRSPLAPDPTPQGSRHKLSRRDLELDAAILGDPIGAIHRLPGVAADSGPNSWFLVRGGSPDEVLTELDGIRIRELHHLTGIVSILDGALLKQATLETSAPDAHLESGLSGGFFLESIQRPTDRIDGAVDLSLLGLSGHVATVLDPESKHSVILSSRRSFLSAYMEAASSLGAVSESTQADYGQYFARYSGQPSKGQDIGVTLLYSHDRIVFDDVNLRHRVLGISADWKWKISDETRLRGQLTHSSNESAQPEDEAFDHPLYRTWQDKEHRTRLRAHFRHEFTAERAIDAGVDASTTSRELAGDFADTRHLPPWIHRPLAELSARAIRSATRSTWPDLILFAQGRWDRILGPLAIRIGLRASLLNRGPRPWIAPRVAASLPLPWGTTFRGSFGLHHQHRLDPLVVDRDTGRLDLLPERAAHLTVAVDQWFDFGLLLGLEAWHKHYDQLVVAPDSPEDLVTGAEFSNEGYGQAQGIEARASLRRGRVGLDVSYTLLRSVRTNPLATRFRGERPAMGDQRHGLHAKAELTIGRRRSFLVALDYSYASGWPTSTLSRAPGPQADTYLWVVSGLQDRRLPDLHRIGLRVEGTHSLRWIRLRGTATVLATPSGSGFVEDCPSLSAEDGAPPSCRSLNYLPVVMPWVGLRAEF